jgi:hypothetical protein
MMTGKTIGVLIAVSVIAIGGAAYFITQPAGDKTATQEPTIAWQFVDAGEKENIPYTAVSVTVNGKAHLIGQFQGSCSEVGATGGVDGKGLLAGELSAAQCWFAGGGDEIGVFAVEDGGLELMVGALSEGIEGGESFRGDFVIKPEFRL